MAPEKSCGGACTLAAPQGTRPERNGGRPRGCFTEGFLVSFLLLVLPVDCVNCGPTTLLPLLLTGCATNHHDLDCLVDVALALLPGRKQQGWSPYCHVHRERFWVPVSCCSGSSARNTQGSLWFCAAFFGLAGFRVKQGVFGGPGKYVCVALCVCMCCVGGGCAEMSSEAAPRPRYPHASAALSLCAHSCTGAVCVQGNEKHLCVGLFCLCLQEEEGYEFECTY